MTDNESIDWDALEIELLPEECRVLLNHGCPFPPERQQLENLVKKRRGIQTFIISEFYLNRLSVDLWKSLEENKIKGKSRTIARRLLERLMYAERWGYADIEMFL